jgi:hypothetical protein
MPPEKDDGIVDYFALKNPTIAQYEAEKQRILREHGRKAMLRFAKEEQFHDYLVEIGELDLHDLRREPQRPATDWKSAVDLLVTRNEDVARARVTATRPEALAHEEATSPSKSENPPTLAARLGQGLGLTKAKAPAPEKEHEPER